MFATVGHHDTTTTGMEANNLHLEDRRDSNLYSAPYIYTSQ